MRKNSTPTINEKPYKRKKRENFPIVKGVTAGEVVNEI